MRAIANIYFNSIMVRLKASRAVVLFGADPKFQFHYGTIKSTNMLPSEFTEK